MAIPPSREPMSPESKRIQAERAQAEILLGFDAYLNYPIVAGVTSHRGSRLDVRTPNLPTM